MSSFPLSAPAAGILLLSHGALAKSMLASTELILGCTLERTVPLGFSKKENLSATRDRVARALQKLAGESSEVLIMCDTCGATASRLASELDTGGRPNVACVYGMNLPMLLEAVSLRNIMRLEELAEHLCIVGRKGVFWKPAGRGTKRALL